jgi:hypothetical protein
MRILMVELPVHVQSGVALLHCSSLIVNMVTMLRSFTMAVVMMMRTMVTVRTLKVMTMVFSLLSQHHCMRSSSS